MADIELQCPSCHQLLELDAGFAGGVCRCFNCGTMMSVPAASQAKSPKGRKLARPSGPTAVRAGEVLPLNPPDHALPEGGRRTRPAVIQATAEVEAEAIVVPDEANVPVARERRKQMTRLAVYGVFGGCIVLAILAMVLAVVVLSRGSSAPVAKPSFDPKQNPFRSEKSNFLSVELAGKAVMVIDGTALSRSWLDAIKDAAPLAAATFSKSDDLQFHIYTDLKPVIVPEHPRPVVASDLTLLRKKWDGAVSIGLRPPTQAIKDAIKEAPSQIVLVTSHQLEAAEAAELGKAFAGAGEIRFDVVLMNSDSPEFQKLAQQQKGTLIRLPESQLRQWLAEVKESAAGDKAK